MKDHDVLQVHDADCVYRKHLSITYDRIIGTQKSMNRKESDEE